MNILLAVQSAIQRLVYSRVTEELISFSKL